MRYYKNINNKPFVFEDNITPEIIAKVEKTHNTTLTEIDKADYVVMTAPTLKQLQARKLNELEISYNTANQKDVAYMDAVFQADNKSQDTIAKVLSVGVVPDDFYWNDKANNKVSMIYTDLQGLAVEILSRNQINFDKLQILKAQVNSATTQAELEAIVW